jgi:hypothetical protein
MSRLNGKMVVEMLNLRKLLVVILVYLTRPAHGLNATKSRL